MSTPTSSSAVIEQATLRYVRERDRYSKLADVVYNMCIAIISRTSVRATVQRRTKEPGSLRRKLQTWSANPDKACRVESVEAIFREIGDLAAVRVTTYKESDRELIVKQIEEDFQGPDGGKPAIDRKDGTTKGNFYRATHCQVVVPEDHLEDLYENIRGESCEIQVCSMLAHVWNEIEHDLRYKPQSGDLEDAENDLLNQLGQLAEAGDICIRILLNATEKRLAELEGDFIDVFDFVARTKSLFPQASNFSYHADQLLDELRKLGIRSPADVQSLLPKAGGGADEAVSLLDGLNQFIQSNEVKNYAPLDYQSSDLLLAHLLRRHAKAIVRKNPVGWGKGRASRLVYYARKYMEMGEPKK